ncbi:hypothetical protein BDV35DRAFT_353980 [Aspergillus flavus]|uniref:Uncharacterized protein n=1 Tax=Aspergillus flavus TaxID=5059 RepID=A0A5N6H1A4_ASPFL|nr:hypothetical protein BDV35DRAFT_353980 [Aspergillus flavus]
MCHQSMLVPSCRYSLFLPGYHSFHSQEHRLRHTGRSPHGIRRGTQFFPSCGIVFELAPLVAFLRALGELTADAVLVSVIGTIWS